MNNNYTIPVSTLSLIHAMAGHEELLCRSDDWLEIQRAALASKIDDLATQLAPVLNALRVKKDLQQKNLVAIPRGSSEGISIMALPDALQELSPNNGLAQCWAKDGYDVNTGCGMRP